MSLVKSLHDVDRVTFFLPSFHFSLVSYAYIFEGSKKNGMEFLILHFMILVIFAYEQCLLCLGYMPDIWYEAALFQQKAAHQLMEKGDVKSATSMSKDVIRRFFLLNLEVGLN